MEPHEKVDEIDYKRAKQFIEYFHYSHKLPRGKNIFFGWYINNELYAVANFGWGVNTYQASYLARITGFPVTNETMLELKRLARSEPRKEEWPLTKFLSKCWKLLRAKGIRYIVSFSDPEYGHSGGIYKAASFLHIGQTNQEIHVIDKDGIKRHRRYPYKYAKRNNCSIEEARHILGLTPIKTAKKDRWFKKI